MNKTYRITNANSGKRRIEATDSGKVVLDIIVDASNVEVATIILEVFGFRCIKREF